MVRAIQLVTIAFAALSLSTVIGVSISSLSADWAQVNTQMTLAL
jgi:hypothetical protein